MKNADEVMLIPHEEGFRAWRTKAGQVLPGDTENKGWRGAGWIALPARTMISVPMRFQGVDASRRESAAQLELEAAGLGTETADTHNFELHMLGQDERDQRASTFVQAAPLPSSVLESGSDAQFAPSVAFRKLTPGEALIWHESGNWVLAVPHDQGGAMHCQALAARTLDADAAAEIRCILASLELGGMQPNLQSLGIVSEDESHDAIPESFENALDLPVSIRRETSPIQPAQSSRLVPAPVVRLRHERQQRRMMVMGVLAFTFVLVAALGAFAVRVLVRERSLITEEAELESLEPELQTIRDAKASWDDLLTALTPANYPVESIYQLVLLLPPEGIRLTRFEIRQDGIVLDGEASSLGHGIEFRDKLLGAPAFSKRWTWEFPNPTSLPDGRATFRAEARPIESATEETTEVTQL
jgi:hypothetical protein